MYRRVCVYPSLFNLCSRQIPVWLNNPLGTVEDLSGRKVRSIFVLLSSTVFPCLWFWDSSSVCQRRAVFSLHSWNSDLCLKVIIMVPWVLSVSPRSRQTCSAFYWVSNPLDFWVLDFSPVEKAGGKTMPISRSYWASRLLSDCGARWRTLPECQSYKKHLSQVRSWLVCFLKNQNVISCDVYLAVCLLFLLVCVLKYG